MIKKEIEFTNEALKKLEPEKERYYVSDPNTAHLRLVVYPSGVKTFLLCRKVKGRSQRIKIGRLSDITILQARKKATELNALIALGGDPQEDKQAKRKEITFGALYELYYQQHAIPFTKHAYANKQTMQRDVLPLFGNMKATEVSAERMRSFHIRLAEKSSPGNANRVLAIVSAVFNFSIKNSYFEGSNPCYKVKKFRTFSRDRFLNNEELALFFDAVEKEEEMFTHFFLMLLYTGARKSNVLAMKWTDIDFKLKQWRISEKESKNGDVNIVYLCDYALKILIIRSAHKKETGLDIPFVFPGTGKEGYLKDPKRAFERIKGRMGISNFRMHDLRRTLGSYMAIGGTSLPIIGKALNHKSQVSTSIYARLSQDPVLEAINSAVKLIKDDDVTSLFESNAEMLLYEVPTRQFSELL